MLRTGSGSTLEVAVVGSGPAGSSAALRLAEAGARVTVIEKARLPRYKTCGGGVVSRAIRLLPADVRQAVERDCYAAELHLAGADLHFSTRRPEPIISMTMRETLDLSLLSAARDAGADVQAPCEVLDVVSHADRVRLETSSGPRWARFVVAADGALSLVARKAGWPETRELIPALEYEVSVGDAALARLGQAARFDLDLAPGGYAWVFPKREHLSIGVLSMRRGPVDLTGAFERYLGLLGLTDVRRRERHGFVIPVRPRTGGFVRRRVLLVGDAAGFAEPVTGEGITFAIQSAQSAARALIEGDLEEDRVRSAYERELAHSIVPELRWGRLLAKLTYDHPAVRTWLARLNGAGFSETLTDVFAGARTYRETLRDPSNYLRALMIRRPRGGAHPAGRPRHGPGVPARPADPQTRPLSRDPR